MVHAWNNRNSSIHGTKCFMIQSTDPPFLSVTYLTKIPCENPRQPLNIFFLISNVLSESGSFTVRIIYITIKTNKSISCSSMLLIFFEQAVVKLQKLCNCSRLVVSSGTQLQWSKYCCHIANQIPQLNYLLRPFQHILTKLITFFYSVRVPAGKGFPNTFAA
jgi:hypothetical protein